MEQQTVSQTPPAGSSPAPVTAEALHASMTSEERSTWQQTGDLPDRVRVAPLKSDVPAASSAAPTLVETPADSSPATPGEPATDDTPASSAAPEPSSQKKPGHKGNADTRIQQLLLENARLQGQLESLSKSAPKADGPPASSAATAPTQKDWQRIMAQPDAPKEADFDSFAEFTAAASYYVTNAVLTEHQARAQEQTTLQREVESIQTVAQSAAERIAKHVESPAGQGFAERVDPRLLNIETASVRRLKGEKVGPQHVLAEETLKSPAVVSLLEHFSSADGQREWQSLLSLPPADLLRAFGRLEARFDTTAAPSAPAPKTVSTAPAPPQTLGTRTADTADPLEAAIKRKDTHAYIREANKRDLAAMGL